MENTLLLVFFDDGFEYQGSHSLLMYLCRQVADLQSKYQAERLEGDKIHQLLAYEETRRCNLEESLDQVHKHARDQHRSLQNQVSVYAFIAGHAVPSSVEHVQAQGTILPRQTANT